MNPDSRIYVAGHRGLVGSAICRRLAVAGFTNVITRTRAECDLTDARAVEALFAETRPEYVFLAAAKVGGIHANDTLGAEFIHQNLMIQNHVIHQCWRHRVDRLLFLGSSCIYPRDCPQPIREEYLLSGPLEETNRPYAIAKIAGVEMCRAYNHQYGTRYVTAMPTNLYGPGDNFDPVTSHVLAALLARAHRTRVEGGAKLTIWGSGTPRREFLHVDDLGAACLFLMQHDDPPELVNIGSGQEVSIRELAEIIRAIAGFTGELEFDKSMPDGTPRKLLDSERMKRLGWRARIALQEGIRSTYDWYLEQRRDDDAG